MQHNVLFLTPPNEMFRGSISRAIRSYAADCHASNPESPGADRSLRESNELASFIDGLPIEDARFVQLLQVSSDSDRFELVADSREFVQKLALDQPASTDTNYVFTQFTVACGTRPAPAPGESELVQKLQAGMTANSQASAKREAELQAELDERDRKIREDSQELSDLRGELNAQGSRAAELQALSRKLAACEGERDQAERRAAAAENKNARRARKAKVAA